MEVGDYVKTKYGIAKLIKIEEDEYFFDNIVGEYVSMFEHDYINQLFEEKLKKIIIKSSPNIIDLIEENDYINGLRVEKNKYGELYTSYVYYGGSIGKQSEIYTTWLKDYEEDEIYSIVTREMFESMEYRIGDE